MRNISLVILLALCLTIHCSSLEQRFLDNMRSMVGNAVNLDNLQNGGLASITYYDWDIRVNEVSANADKEHQIEWIGGHLTEKPGQYLKDLRFGENLVSNHAVYTNHIGDGKARLIATVFAGERKNGRIRAKASILSYSSYVHKQYNEHRYQHCWWIFFIKKCEWRTRRTDRGLHPHEFAQFIDGFRNRAFGHMYADYSGRTGLKAISSEPSLGVLYVEESRILRKYYNEIKYDYAEVDNIAHDELSNSIKETSRNQITDNFELEQINDYTSFSDHCSFFQVPNDRTIIVTSVKRNHHGYYNIRMSFFQVNGKTPAGAFAASVGSWDLIKTGQNASPSAPELLTVFPALK